MKYIIPFKKRPIKIGQMFNMGSHRDWIEDKEDMTYSLDFLLQEGTEIIASREGKVTKVKSEGKRNYSGKDLKKGEEAYKKHMNEIEIKHSDGTFSSYAHLKNKGVFVKVGEKVNQGQVIGLSGNTGWSSEPHLDFCIFRKNYQNRKIKTIKFNFLDYGGQLEEKKGEKMKIRKEDFEKILEYYDIGEHKSHKNIFTGTNTIYIIKTNKGKFLMKIFENASLKFVKDQINLMEFLKKTKVSTPKIINTKSNQGLLIYNKNKIIIQEFIEGKNPVKFSLELIKDLAKKFGTLGQILLKYKKKPNSDWKKNHEFKLINWKIKNISNINVEEESKSLIKFLKKININKLRKSIVHGDLTDSNFLIKNKKLLAFIDWDDFHEDYLIYEISVFIAHCLITKKEIKTKLIKSFLTEYQKVIKLNNEEKRALYYFVKQRMLAAASWSVNQIEKHKDKDKEFLKWASQMIDKYKIFNKITLEEFLKLL